MFCCAAKQPKVAPITPKQIKIQEVKTQQPTSQPHPTATTNYSNPRYITNVKPPSETTHEVKPSSAVVKKTAVINTTVPSPSDTSHQTEPIISQEPVIPSDPTLTTAQISDSAQINTINVDSPQFSNNISQSQMNPPLLLENVNTTTVNINQQEEIQEEEEVIITMVAREDLEVQVEENGYARAMGYIHTTRAHDEALASTEENLNTEANDLAITSATESVTTGQRDEESVFVDEGDEDILEHGRESRGGEGPPVAVKTAFGDDGASHAVGVRGLLEMSFMKKTKKEEPLIVKSGEEPSARMGKMESRLSASSLIDDDFVAIAEEKIAEPIITGSLSNIASGQTINRVDYGDSSHPFGFVE